MTLSFLHLPNLGDYARAKQEAEQTGYFHVAHATADGINHIFTLGTLGLFLQANDFK